MNCILLYEYSLTYDQVYNMLCYAIEEPPSDANDKRTYKFPFISSEAFSISVPSIIDMFFDESNDKLLRKLLSFIESEPELNPVLAGYFGKVFNSLINKKRLQLLSYILIDNRKYIEKLIGHMYNQSIADSLSLLLKLDTESEIFHKEIKECSVSILDSIYNSSPKNNLYLDLVRNSFSVLSTLPQTSNSTEFATSESFIMKIYESIENNEIILKEALKYLITIMKMKINSNISPTEESDIIPIDCSYIIKGALNNMENYKEVLEEKKEIFGRVRLVIIEWFQFLLKLRDETVIKKASELKFPQTLLYLLNEYSMNSNLHLFIYRIFNDAITSNNKHLLNTVCLWL